MTITTETLVTREVHYCVSSLVSMIACGNGAGVDLIGSDLATLSEQAAELCSPIEDWESAAMDAGWHFTPSGYVNDDPDATGPDAEAATTDNPWIAEDWQQLCVDLDIDPYEREVFEHWIVSDWLADKLAERGEKVDKDFAGLTVWARTTTGQAIHADHVFDDILREMGE